MSENFHHHFLSDVKSRIDLLLNPKTHWIHLDEDEVETAVFFKIPLFENLSYVLLLLSLHQLELATNAFERLERLLSYYVKDQGFPETLHDYPNVKSYSLQFKILLILKILEKKYIQFFKPNLKLKLTACIENLIQVLKSAELSLSCQIKLTILETGKFPADFNRLKCSSNDLADLLIFSFNLYPESISYLSQAASAYDAKTQVYLSRDFTEKQLFQVELKTPYHLLMEFLRKKVEISAYLNKTLIYAPLLSQAWLNQTLVFKECDYTLRVFDRKTWKEPFLSIAFLKNLSLSLSALAEVVVERFEDTLKLKVNYPSESLDERATLDEIQVFLTHHDEANFSVEHENATTFFLNDSIYVKNQNEEVFVKMSFESSRGQFMGTLSRGNRPGQVKKGFTPFDQIIGIRTITREPNAEVVITLNIYPAYIPASEGLSIPIPMA